MAEPKTKEPVWKRALNKVLGIVPLKESYYPFAEKNMAKILTPKEVRASNVQGLYSVYGKEQTDREGRRAYNRGEALALPNYSETAGYYMPHPSGNGYARTGFTDVPTDPGGNPIPGAPAQKYTTPATFTERDPTPEEQVNSYRDFLAAQYDAKVRRGENLGDIDTYITEGLISRAKYIEARRARRQPANKGAMSDGENSTGSKGSSSK